jgi:hypothetical protein
VAIHEVLADWYWPDTQSEQDVYKRLSPYNSKMYVSFENVLSE